ncbi:MAG: histidine phosphatase family protein [Anaerolineales bacterium]
MKKIWLVRHAESTCQTGETDDSVNPELSDRGKQQARHLGFYFSDTKFDLALISPLARASQTFALSGIQTKLGEFDSRLIESDWGNEGKYRASLPISTPDIAEPDRHEAWLLNDNDRITGLMEDILEWDVEKILCIGHWGSLHHLLLSFIGVTTVEDYFRATLDNASVSLLEIDDRGVRCLRYWNDRSHLRDLLD